MYQLSTQTDNFDFWNQFAQKESLSLKMEKSEHHH